MKIEDGDIIPAVGISNKKLDITKEELLKMLKKDFMERSREDDLIITIDCLQGMDSSIKGREIKCMMY